MSDKFFFGLRFPDGLPFPDQTVFSNSGKAPSTEDRDDIFLLEDTGHKVDGAENFIQLQRSFFSQMHDYMDGLPGLLSTVPTLQTAILGVFAATTKEEIAVASSEDGDWKFFEIPEEELVRFKKDYERVVRHGRAMTNIPEMVMLGFVSQFDAFLARLLRLCFEKRPDLIVESQKNFVASEVLKYSSLEDFREAVIEKEIETFLRSSHSEQFDWMEKKFQVKLRKDLDSWPEFIETFERRNLFAHSRGVVSEQYRIKCKSAGLKEVPEKGEKLTATASYVGKKLRIFAEIGVKLTQVLSRVLDKSEANLERNDSVLNEICYRLIEHSHYGLASDLLKFGLTIKHHPDDVLHKMMVVNLANSLKCAGKNTEAMSVLAGHKWAATATEFKISVAAIREDVTSVVDLMPVFAPTDMSSQEALRRWPVFVHVRDTEEFVAAFKGHFGCEFRHAFDIPVREADEIHTPSTPLLGN